MDVFLRIVSEIFEVYLFLQQGAVEMLLADLLTPERASNASPLDQARTSKTPALPNGVDKGFLPYDSAQDYLFRALTRPDLTSSFYILLPVSILVNSWLGIFKVTGYRRT